MLRSSDHDEYKVLPDGKKSCVMLNAALMCLVLGLVVWGLSWTGLAVMPIQIYWFFTVAGMLIMVIHVMTRRATRVW